MVVKVEVAAKLVYHVELPDGTPKAQAKVDAPAKLRTEAGNATPFTTAPIDWPTVTMRPVAIVETVTDTNV